MIVALSVLLHLLVDILTLDDTLHIAIDNYLDLIFFLVTTKLAQCDLLVHFYQRRISHMIDMYFRHVDERR